MGRRLFHNTLFLEVVMSSWGPNVPDRDVSHLADLPTAPDRDSDDRPGGESSAVWIVQGKYGNGWENVMFAESEIEADRAVQDYYQHNPGYSFRYVLDDPNSEAGQFATAVAAALGDGWSRGVDPHGQRDRGVIDGPDCSLWVRIGGWHNEGRATINGEWPSDLRGYQPRGGDEGSVKSITVAADRDPVQIARDVERRLLPRFREALRVARERKGAADDYASRQNRLLDQVQRSLGALFKPDENDGVDHERHTLSFGGYRYRDNGPTITGTVKVYDSDVEVELRVSRALINSLALTLAELAKHAEGPS